MAKKKIENVLQGVKKGKKVKPFVKPPTKSSVVMKDKSSIGLKAKEALRVTSTKTPGHSVAKKDATAKKKKLMTTMSKSVAKTQTIKKALASGDITLKRARQMVGEKEKQEVIAELKRLEELKARLPKEIDPYTDLDREMEDVGTQPFKGKLGYGKIRFSSDYIIAVEDIPLEPSANYYVTSYPGWSIKRVKVRIADGEDDTAPIVDKNGKEKNRFNFSGRVGTLPELHRALRKLRDNSKPAGHTELSQALEMKPDRFGIVDISQVNEPIYDKKVYCFSGFAALIEPTGFISESKTPVTYTAVTITKQKSEKAKKSPKNVSKKNFFSLNIPVQQLPRLIMAIEVLMKKNNLEWLPMTMQPEQENEVFSKQPPLPRARGEKRKRKELLTPEFVDDNGNDIDMIDSQPTAGPADTKKTRRAASCCGESMDGESDTEAIESDSEDSEYEADLAVDDDNDDESEDESGDEEDEEEDEEEEEEEEEEDGLNEEDEEELQVGEEDEEEDVVAVDETASSKKKKKKKKHAAAAADANLVEPLPLDVGEVPADAAVAAKKTAKKLAKK